MNNELTGTGKWCENVIIADADYIDKVAFDLIVNFERMLERRIPQADMARWIDCVALDGGLREGDNRTQVVLIHDKKNLKLDNFRPCDYADELTKFLESVDYSGNYLQLGILENWAQYKDQLIAQMPELFTAERVADIDAFRSGMYLGGLDMTAIPHWKDGVIVLIPIFSLLTSLASSGISMLIQKKTNPAMAQQTASMVAMMLMMPFFSFYITFKVPAAVGFYWIISNVVSLLQQLFIAKFFPPKKSQAKLMVENTIYRRSREENLKKTRA